MRIRRRKGPPAYILTVAPLGAELTAGERPLAMILVADPDELSPSARDLAQAFGLSPAESRLAAALLARKRPSDIAAASGVRITRVRVIVADVVVLHINESTRLAEPLDAPGLLVEDAVTRTNRADPSMMDWSAAGTSAAS